MPIVDIVPEATETVQQVGKSSTGIFYQGKVERLAFIACFFYIIHLVSFKSGKLRKINTKVVFFLKFVTICMIPFYVKWPLFVEKYICLERFLTK